MPVTLLMTGYYRHPKFVLANSISGGELAEVLWSRALDYVNEHGTDGFVPTGAPQIVCPTKTAVRIKALVQAGLWHPTENGWEIHDFLEWNRAAAELNAKAKAKSEVRRQAGRKGAAARWGGRIDRPDDGNRDGNTDGSAVAQ
jgi:hypothetical protein